LSPEPFSQTLPLTSTTVFLATASRLRSRIRLDAVYPHPLLMLFGLVIGSPFSGTL
jgi:hypothetical protein